MVYSIVTLIEKYSENKELYDAYFQNKTVECYDDNQGGMSDGAFIALLLVSVIVWICALSVTIKLWHKLPDWARVIAILGLLPIVPGGPIITLVVVFIARNNNKSQGKKK